MIGVYDWLDDCKSARDLPIVPGSFYVTRGMWGLDASRFLIGSAKAMEWLERAHDDSFSETYRDECLANAEMWRAWSKSLASDA